MTPRVYRGLTQIAGPVIYLYLRHRLRAGKEDPVRFAERLGCAGLPRPSGPLAWLHAASVGEAQSVLSLIQRLLADRPSLSLLVTSGTVTSASLLAERLPERARHQYVPVDRLPWVRRFLDHWLPDIALWVESELWPNLVGETQRRHIPMVLLNGRMSARSFAGWQRVPGVVRPLLQGFSFCFAQSEVEAQRFAQLGANDVICAGNLKYAANPLPVDQEMLRSLSTAIGDRSVWLAASTHPGEEQLVGQAHCNLKEGRANLVTIIVPRHATRGAAVAAELTDAGLIVARRSRADPVTPDTDVLLADTMGELGLFYRLAPVGFVGGSLVSHGGQNVVEPARLDCAIIHGPHMFNFRDIVDEMQAVGATTEVTNADSLVAAVDQLLGDPARRSEQVAAARQIAERSRGILERVISELTLHLDALGGPKASCARA